MIEQLGHFHFLRPEWLLLIPGLLLFERLLRNPRLTAIASMTSLRPSCWSISGCAGPGGTLQSLLGTGGVTGATDAGHGRTELAPATLAPGRGCRPLVIALDISESMATTDIAPSRLARGIQKVTDLLKLIPDKQIGIVAYAGSAHTVLPLTTDHDIAQNFLSVLNPDLAPRPGKFPEYALPGIDKLLSNSYYKSSVLLLADGSAAPVPH